MTKKEMELRDGNLFYEVHGTGEAILLLHGFCGSSAYWDDVVPTLAKSHQVFVLDLPGHGASDASFGNYEMEYMADLLRDFLDAVHIDKVTMIGHSLGGYITLAFAEKYEDRLNGFSLVHSTSLADSEEGKEGREAAIAKIESEGLPAFIEGLIPKLFAPNAETDSLQEKAKAIGYKTSKEGAVGFLRAMKNRKDRTTTLEDSSVKALLVAGEKDGVIPPEKTFLVNRERLSLALIKDAGHMSMMEQPSQLIEKLESFLEE
ncbi:alpha/beta fold hydrolase [Paenisporosarcina cavernae]|uniref:Alpha/beta hydrolase n=1 Tax=Paenisporosarcina cavernae TaxID=2320858 RepID=A0A385YPU1_9BACL|nr:alpha/beta hydrolase [Paenisporosarcina cavernae]AYC28616.1 alpha/beta hydrolase [Paenisporosarcina cavernae]